MHAASVEASTSWPRPFWRPVRRIALRQHSTGPRGLTAAPPLQAAQEPLAAPVAGCDGLSAALTSRSPGLLTADHRAWTLVAGTGRGATRAGSALEACRDPSSSPGDQDEPTLAAFRDRARRRDVPSRPPLEYLSVIDVEGSQVADFVALSRAARMAVSPHQTGRRSAPHPPGRDRLVELNRAGARDRARRRGSRLLYCATSWPLPAALRPLRTTAGAAG
jgi:hypothetical protein